MAVKVTGQFIPAGDFSIIDGKDVSGNITGSNFSGSLTSTGSFGRVEATSISGDGSGLSNVFEGTAPSSSISTRLTNLTSDSASFSTRVTDLKTDSGSFSARVTDLKTDSGSFSTRVTNLKTDSGSFSTRVTNLKTDSGSFSTRVTNLKTDSGSFSTRVTRNEGTGSKILAGELEFTNITASNNARIDGNLTVAGNYTVSGDTTFVSSSTLIIGDNIIEVNAVNPVRYGGIYVKDVDNEQTGSLIWDSTNDYWVAGQSGSEFRIPLQNSTSNLTDNKIVIAQSNGRIESGNITDDGTSVTIPLPITASSHISSSGNIIGTNLVADSASVSTRLTTEESNIDALQTDSGSFSTRVTNLKSDSGSFSTRITNLKSDSGSFSTRITNLKSDSGSFSTRTTDLEVASASFSTRITTAETELEETIISASAQLAEEISGSFTAPSASLSTRITNLKTDSASFSSRITTAEEELELTLISGSAQLATQISGAFESVSSSLSDRLQTAEIELEETLISGSAQLANQISGAFTSGFEFNGTISGSATSTGSFGRVEVASRVEAEHIHSTDDISAADDITAGGRLVAETDAKIANIVTLDVNGIQVGGDTRYIRVGSDSDFEINHRHPQHTSPFRASTNTNIITDKTNHGLLLFGGNPGIIMESAVSASEGVFLSGSRANIELRGGNISGSATSTGSFGRVEVTSGKILGDSTSAVSVPFSIVGGTSAAAGGLQFGAYNADFGGIWPAGVTPAASNYAFVARNGRTVLNTTTDIGLYKDDASVLLFANSTGVAIGGDSLNPGYKLDVIGTGRFTGNLTLGGNVVGDDATNISGVNNITALGDISGSATSTGSFANIQSDKIVVDSGDNPSIDVRNSGRIRVMRANTAHNYLQMNADANGFNYIEWYNGALRFAPGGGTKLIMHTNGHFGINTTTDAGYWLDVNGTARFTGTLTTGIINSSDIVSASSFNGIFNGALSGSAQIASNISGAFAVASASFAADILSNSSSFAARDTLSEATSSKILNGQLEFTNITGSGHVSMSLSSTGSFGRVSATTIGGHSPLTVDSNTTFTNSITGSGHVSASLTSTASFGNVSVKSISGHESLLINTKVTASSDVQFDGKVFFETGSIEGDLHIRTNENLMRLGKSTKGIILSGSVSASRFATGSDGSIIDLGFTIVDEDGDTVLAGDGDGIHVDSNNYWYNNKFYRVGDDRNDFLIFDTEKIKYSGEVIAQTGSINGELHIVSPTGSMFIGKFTGGIPSSGSSNISRFATGSDGSVIDLGFTTTDEDGNTVFLTTGDGIVVDSTNYWYTTGHFKIGDSDNFINWDTDNLNISGTFVGDGSGLTGIGAATVPAGTVSSSLQLATSISGSFTSVSASLASRITDGGITLPTNTLTSSAQISTQISGAFTQPSSSISTRITTLEGNPVFSSAGISGSFQILSQSLANRLTVGGLSLPTNTVSSSAQLSSNISGSFTTLSQSFASRLTTGGLTLPTNTISSSAQLAVSISGSFVQPSASFSTRVTSLEAGGGSVPTGTVSGSAQIASNISGAFAVASASFASDINDLQSDSGSFSTRVTNLKSDSGSFSTRVTNLKTDSGSFSTRITNFSTGNVEIISGSASSTGSFGALGIGVASPYYKGHINFDDSTTSFTGGSSGNWGGNGLRIENTNATANTKATLQLRANDFDALISAVKKSGGNQGEVHFNVDPTADSNQLLTLAGSKISGSSTSTGSFGSLVVADKVQGSLTVGTTIDASTGSFGNVYVDEALEIGNGTQAVNISILGPNSNANSSKLSFGDNNSAGVYPGYNGVSFRFDSDANKLILEDEYNMNQAGTRTLFEVPRDGNFAISGSATSTGSFGHIIGDGSEITNVTATLPSGVISGSNGNITASLNISAVTGSISNIQTPLTGRVISNFTEMIKVTVVSDGGNHYAFEGATAPSIQVSEGKTYRFDISDSTVGSHPFRLSTTEDGQHNGGSAYTTGVTLVGTQGQAGAYLEIKVDKNTANALYYYCTAHPGMGNDGRLLKNDLMNLAAIKVTGNQVDFTNLPTSDPSVAGRLWNDSGTVKISSG